MKAIIFIGLAVALLGLGSGCKHQRPLTAAAQIRRMAAADAGRDSFALSELRDMPSWTTLYVFGPYTPTNRIQQTLGFEWKEADNYGLEASETSYLAVFVSGGRVVRAEKWPRYVEWSPESLSLTPTTVVTIDRSGARPILKIAEPGGAANRSHPVQPQTNRTSPAAGSGG